MDLNEKLAQRRKERDADAAAIQAEVAAKEAVKAEFIKTEAKKRLAEEGLQQTIDADTEQAIQKEKEKIIEKMAQEKWTAAENIAGLVFVGLTIWGFFQWWMLGIIFMIVGVLYHNKTMKKYRDRIVDEMANKNV